MLYTIATVIWNGTGVDNPILFIYYDELFATAGVAPITDYFGPGRLVCSGSMTTASWKYVSGSEVLDKDFDNFIQTRNSTGYLGISRLTRNSNHPIVTSSDNNIDGLWVCDTGGGVSISLEFVGLYSRIQGEWIVRTLALASGLHNTTASWV